MERLSPSELAKQVKDTPVQNKEKFSDPNISRMIHKAQAEKVYRCIEAGNYEVTDEGHIILIGVDGAGWDDPFHLAGFRVQYEDKEGYRTPLGGIQFQRPQAYANVAPDKVEAIESTDPRWDAIVGTIGRAIVSCTVEKPKTQQ